MKTKIFLILAITSVLLTSCKDDDKNAITDTNWCDTPPNSDSYRWAAFLYPKDSKLKRIYQVDSQYVFIQMLSEYVYDDSGRIEKVNYPTSDNSYDDYKYDTSGRLSSISSYRNNDLTKTDTFTYDESGNKIKEEIDDMTEGSLYYGVSYTLFLYDNNRLSKTENYQNDSLKYYQLYEYNDSNELIKEKLFVPGDDSYVTTEHTYAEGMLIYSVTYSGDDKENGFLFDTKRYYDLNDNMTLTIDNMPFLSNYMSPDGKQPAFLERRVYEYYGND